VSSGSLCDEGIVDVQNGSAGSPSPGFFPFKDMIKDLLSCSILSLVPQSESMVGTMDSSSRSHP
jgi:hypothetical protein